MYKFLILVLLFNFKLSAIPHYYATAADERFFHTVLRLINTIHTHDSQNIGKIAVFDLGLNASQRSYLNSLNCVHVYDLERKHPDILKLFLTCDNGRKVRGWFAWKPVVIKQALDLFPYVLYLDAGLEVLNPLDQLFLHIAQNGYYLIESGNEPEQPMLNRITQTVINKITSKLSPSDQELVFDASKNTLSAGFQGLSREYYDCYLRPVYNWVDDITVFADDGTAKLGFGQGRHDQIIFSIYAFLNKMYINPIGWQTLIVDGEPQTIHCHWHRNELIPESLIKY